MADEDENIKKEINYYEDDEEEKEEEEEKPINRPESPRTTAARYLLDLANFGSASNNITDTQEQHKQDLKGLSINTWGHDKSQSYIEECGLPFTSDQMLMACRTFMDLNHFLANYQLTEEQVALCFGAYQMGKGNNQSSNSPGTEATLDSISGWNYHLIHVLDHSYASMHSLQMENTTMNMKHRQCSSTAEDVSYSSDGGASSTGSNVTESDSRKTSWDERNYRRLGLPNSYEEIVDSPMDEFNELMNNGNLTEEQIMLCRNTRRRGKNKVAAQNCRRRKLGLISRLKDELDATRKTRRQLLDERQKLTQDCGEWALRVSDVKTMVLNGLGKNPRKYCIEITDQSAGERRESLVLLKKRKRSSNNYDKPQSDQSHEVPYKMSEIPPHVNGIIKQCFDQMETKEHSLFTEDENEETIMNHNEREEKSYHEPEIVVKEEILEIEMPSHI